jgi:hypothetical protein
MIHEKEQIDSWSAVAQAASLCSLIQQQAGSLLYIQDSGAKLPAR